MGSVVAKAIQSDSEMKHLLKWECSSECKPLTNIEVNAIVALASFPGHMGMRLLLQSSISMQHTLDT